MATICSGAEEKKKNEESNFWEEKYGYLHIPLRGDEMESDPQTDRYFNDKLRRG